MNIMHSNDAHANLHARVMGYSVITKKHLLVLHQMQESGLMCNAGE